MEKSKMPSARNPCLKRLLLEDPSRKDESVKEFVRNNGWKSSESEETSR